QLIGRCQGLLSLLPGRGNQGRPEVGAQCLGPRKQLEGAPQPLAIGRIPLLLQEAQPHKLTHKAGGDNAGAQIIPDISTTPHERLFFADATPLSSKAVTPDVLRVVGKLLTQWDE